jgi:hypothetical protein
MVANLKLNFMKNEKNDQIECPISHNYQKQTLKCNWGLEDDEDYDG